MAVFTDIFGYPIGPTDTSALAGLTDYASQGGGEGGTNYANAAGDPFAGYAIAQLQRQVPTFNNANEAANYYFDNTNDDYFKQNIRTQNFFTENDAQWLKDNGYQQPNGSWNVADYFSNPDPAAGVQQRLNNQRYTPDFQNAMAKYGNSPDWINRQGAFDKELASYNQNQAGQDGISTLDTVWLTALTAAFGAVAGGGALAAGEAAGGAGADAAVVAGTTSAADTTASLLAGQEAGFAAGDLAGWGGATTAQTGGWFVGSNGFLGSTGNGFFDSVANGAVKGGVQSGVQGQNPLTGAVSGGLSGGLSGLNSSGGFFGSNGYFGDTGSGFLNNTANGALNGGIKSGLTGGNPIYGAASGGIGAGMSDIWNNVSSAVSDWWNSGSADTSSLDSSANMDFSNSISDPYSSKASLGSGFWNAGTNVPSLSGDASNGWGSLSGGTGLYNPNASNWGSSIGSGGWGGVGGVNGNGDLSALINDYVNAGGNTGSSGSGNSDGQGGQPGGRGFLNALQRVAPGALAAYNQNKLAKGVSNAYTPFSSREGSMTRLDPSIRALQDQQLGNNNQLYNNAGANAGGYIQSQVDPVIEQAAGGYGTLLQDQARRGIRGSSFGNQDITNYQTDSQRNISDARAKATQQSIGLQNVLNGNFGDISNQRSAQEMKALGFSGDGAATKYAADRNKYNAYGLGLGSMLGGS